MRNMSKMRKTGIAVFTAVLFCVLLPACGKKEFVYREQLSAAVLKVDGRQMALSELSFYILDTESTVQKQAEEYSPQSPTKYWDAHVNGKFLVLMVKEAIIDTAVRDEIFYEMAKKDGVSLNQEEIRLVQDKASEYCAGLTDFQKEATGLDEEAIVLAMEKIGTVEKYVGLYSIEHNCDPADLNVDGEVYRTLLKEHKWKLYKKVWDEVKVGTVSIESNYLIKS